MSVLQQFPEEFSQKAISAVIREELIAGRDFETAKQKADELSGVEELLRTYILRVFLLFVREGGDLVRQGIWSLDRLQGESLEFLRKLTIGASLERGYDKNGRPVREMVSRWSGGLLQDVRQEFRKSTLWQEFEGLLIELAAVETQPALSGQETGQKEVDWEDIEITFVSDERVQVRMSEQNLTFNYAEMGFADSRSGKPNQAWRLLHTLAQVKGVIPNSARDGKDFIAFGKRVERLRHRLRAHFKIASDPVPFDPEKGYCCRFKVECGPAFNT
jgi:hypothetical protein